MRRTSNVATSLRQRPAAALALALGVSLIWGSRGRGNARVRQMPGSWSSDGAVDCSSLVTACSSSSRDFPCSDFGRNGCRGDQARPVPGPTRVARGCGSATERFAQQLLGLRSSTGSDSYRLAHARQSRTLRRLPDQQPTEPGSSPDTDRSPRA